MLNDCFNFLHERPTGCSDVSQADSAVPILPGSDEEESESESDEVEDQDVQSEDSSGVIITNKKSSNVQMYSHTESKTTTVTHQT